MLARGPVAEYSREMKFFRHLALNLATGFKGLAAGTVAGADLFPPAMVEKGVESAIFRHERSGREFPRECIVR